MSKKIAQYQIIKDDLKEKILSGYYKPNDIIPSEQELSRIYGVSRVTIRKATDLLVFDGLLNRRPGYGTTIAPHAMISKSIKHLAFRQEMEAQGKKVRTDVHKFTLIEANAQIASILGIKEKEMVYYFERIRYADDEPLQFECTYMSIQKYPDLNISYLQESKYRYIEDIKKQSIDFCVHTVNPIMAPPEIAAIFRISTKEPILKINNITYLTDGSIMDYTVQYSNPEKYQMKYIRNRNSV